MHVHNLHKLVSIAEERVHQDERVKEEQVFAQAETLFSTDKYDMLRRQFYEEMNSVADEVYLQSERAKAGSKELATLLRVKQRASQPPRVSDISRGGKRLAATDTVVEAIESNLRKLQKIRKSRAETHQARVQQARKTQIDFARPSFLPF